jgi:23S rRNA pseudouridine2605 synthase
VNKRTQLKRALSKLGWCSRGVAEAWIAAGKVRVNGEAALSGDQWVEIGADRIEVDGRAAPPDASAQAGAGEAGRERVYLLLHKPPGYVTTRSDELGRKTVYDLLPEDLRTRWLFPVGRLDLDSEGLLLMSDDGAWSDSLTDPESHVDKEYRVKLDGRPLPAELESFRSGILLQGRLTRPAQVREEDAGWYRVTLREGRNRQIRRMFHALGYKVKRLVRVSMGPLGLGDLAAGAIRRLGQEEIEALRKAAGGRRTQ